MTLKYGRPVGYQLRNGLGEIAHPQLSHWTLKHPQDWSRKDVLDWIYCVVDQEQMDGSQFHGEAYREFLGRDLCKMDKKQFQKVDPYYGTKIYETFRDLLNQMFFQKPRSGIDSFINLCNLEYAIVDRNISRRVAVTHCGGDLNEGACSRQGHTKCNNDLVIFHTDNDIKVDLPNLGVYPISEDIELPLTAPLGSTLPSPSPSQLQDCPQLTPTFDSLSIPSFTQLPSSLTSPMTSVALQEPFYCSFKSGTSSSNMIQPLTSVISSSNSSASTSFVLSFSSSLSGYLTSPMSSLTPPMSTADTYDQGYSSEDSTLGMTFMPPLEPSPPSDAFVNDITDSGISDSKRELSFLRDKISRQEERKVKNNTAKQGNHLWEFVLDLLRNPAANPKLLKWEDKEVGVFRFVQSQKVAQLWGEKKNNPQMNYEKMSRAMRFCRTNGFFEDIPKTGRFPKKLCFRFGVKAHGWRD